MSNNSNTALLVMDYQEGIVSRIGDSSLVERMAGVVEAARAASIPVIFVVVRFRAGYPEISPSNLGFSQVKASGMDLTETSTLTQVHTALAPREDEPVVSKRRVGAFAGSDLEVILRSKEIKSLVLAGISTSGVVLSTVRLAADMDYRLTVIADCCADPDEEVHRVLTEKVFPRQATIVTADAWKESLGKD